MVQHMILMAEKYGLLTILLRFLLVGHFISTTASRVCNKDKPWFNYDYMLAFDLKQEAYLRRIEITLELPWMSLVASRWELMKGIYHEIDFVCCVILLAEISNTIVVLYLFFVVVVIFTFSLLVF